MAFRGSNPEWRSRDRGEGRDGIQALREAAVPEGHTWQYLRWMLTSLSLSLKVRDLS